MSLLISICFLLTRYLQSGAAARPYL